MGAPPFIVLNRDVPPVNIAAAAAKLGASSATPALDDAFKIRKVIYFGP